MIHIISGDLLKSDCTIIGHQCNCWGVMGAGIAKQIRLLYPEVHETDKNFSIPYGADRLGRFSYTKVKDKKVENRLIFNLYGQNRYGRKRTYTKVEALQQAVDTMLQFIQSEYEGTIKIGLPFGIGAGLSGGNWDEISQMLSKVSEQNNQDIFLYQLPSPDQIRYHREQ
ncbi:Appr-1-p processing protein [Shimazuella sp. AN120528]|uniref:Appr-1-p processing protein n=1 Tax=Shimazuella soli TaxID=1892854 RepID=UPI001F0E4128|nr:Appr-1-p processing protein [Shimazuella soli]MCH5585437.1 Appr-1-p processing protein [Shimazuella soli]